MKRKLSRSAKLAALLSLICVSSASGEIVEIPTATFGFTATTKHETLIDTSASKATADNEGETENEIALVQFAQSPAAQTPAPATQAQTPNLPTTPNLPINQLTPPPAPNAQNFGNAALPSSLGATSGAASSSPNMIGDIFGGGFSRLTGSQTVHFNGYAPGFVIQGTPGASSSILAFEFGGDSVPNDIFTDGSGMDNAGTEGFADTFNILEPIPPNDAPTSPGPGFVFDGGTAVYTNNTSSTTAQPGMYTDGQQWYVAYSYTSDISSGINGGSGGGSGVRSFIPVPEPGLSSRRVKISENFSPEVRDRFFTNYSFFNDAYGGLGDISRYILGFERILVEDLISIEARLPMAGTYGSFQQIDRPESRNFELGNAALIAKGVLLRTPKLLLSSGLGITMPLADDTSVTSGNREILRIENLTFHLLPFVGAIYKLNEKSAIQSYLQLDVAANGDPVLANLTGGPLQKLGTFTDSTLLFADVALSHRIYQNRRARFLRTVHASGEMHYTGTLQGSDIVANNGLTYTNLQNNFNIVNTTMGLHFQLGDRLVVSPAMAVPLSSGLNKQFDYEAIVQINYFR